MPEIFDPSPIAASRWRTRAWHSRQRGCGSERVPFPRSSRGGERDVCGGRSTASAVVDVRGGRLSPTAWLAVTGSTSWLVGAGYGLVLSAVVALNILAREPSWFLLLAGPGQLLAMVGFGIWAVWGKRRQVFNLGVALLGAIGGLTAIIGSEAGLSVLIAGFWFALAAQREVRSSRTSSAFRT